MMNVGILSFYIVAFVATRNTTKNPRNSYGKCRANEHLSITYILVFKHNLQLCRNEMTGNDNIICI